MRTGAAGQWAQAARRVGGAGPAPRAPPQAACGPDCSRQHWLCKSASNTVIKGVSSGLLTAPISLGEAGPGWRTLAAGEGAREHVVWPPCLIPPPPQLSLPRPGTLPFLPAPALSPSFLSLSLDPPCSSWPPRGEWQE